jgi:hypothetical protein
LRGLIYKGNGSRTYSVATGSDERRDGGVARAALKAE